MAETTEVIETNRTRRKLKTWSELTFADDFMFCKVLQNNPDLCMELTELILGQRIGSIVQMEKQHPIEITADGRGVRFDIYMKDSSGTIFDIEMQTVNQPELPRRTRYYHSMIDLEALERNAASRIESWPAAMLFSSASAIRSDCTDCTSIHSATVVKKKPVCVWMTVPEALSYQQKVKQMIFRLK